MISDIGRVLCLPVQDEDLPLMGKLAQGPMTMRMLPGESLVGAVSQSAGGEDLLVGSRNGALMRLSLSALRRCKRGDLGEMAITLEGKGNDADRLVSACSCVDLVGVVTSKGRHGRIITADLGGNEDSTALTLKTDEQLSQLVPLLS